MKPINKEKFIKFQEAWGPHFLDQKVCIAFLADLLGTNKACPKCGAVLNDNIKLRVESGARVSCPECKSIFGYKTNTALGCVGLNPEKICILMLGMVLDTNNSWSNNRLGELCGMSHHSVEKYREQFEECLK